MGGDWGQLRFTAEMLRRTIPARIDVGMERLGCAHRPRSGTRTCERGKAESRRTALCRLTLVRNWFAQGAPRFNDRIPGSFETGHRLLVERWRRLESKTSSLASSYLPTVGHRSEAFRIFIDAWSDVFQSKLVTVNYLITSAKTRLVLGRGKLSSRMHSFGMSANGATMFLVITIWCRMIHRRSWWLWSDCKLVAVDRQTTTEASTERSCR